MARNKYINEMARRWIDRLFANTDKQGRGTLFSISGGVARFCCLGIGELVWGKTRTLSASEGLLSEQIRKDLGLIDCGGIKAPTAPESLPISLVYANDALKMTFPEIAKLLEDNAEHYFLEVKEQ